MSAKIYSATNIGLASHLIEVEADISYGTTKFLIVGLPDMAVQEAKERVRSAVKNSGLNFPRTRVTVNLAPADLKKIGPSFDLPIALSVLLAKGQIKLTTEDSQALFIGELSLDGSLKPVNGILNIASSLLNWRITKLYLPAENAPEAGLIAGIKIFPVSTFAGLIDHLSGKKMIAEFAAAKIKLSKEKRKTFCLAHIKGQQQVKRALEITAAGYHNLLMVGPPGSGKTLLARALAELLPPLSLEESLEVTKIYSLSGMLPDKKPLIVERPFRSPHHTSSGIALIGGGSFPRPGEITLAHRGILFLDELPEFPRMVLENLRQPLEDGVITISRAATSVQYPARFTLVAAANPCPCGFATDAKKQCQCGLSEIRRYQKKISGPILDRIDLHVEVPRLEINELINDSPPLDLSLLLKKIKQAHQLQHQRFKNSKILYNSEIDHQKIEKFCPLDKAGKQLLKQAVIKLQLTARSYHKVIKIARTIADLENSENIRLEHLAESLQYRQMLFN